MTFNPNIDLGNILVIVTIVFSMISVVIGVRVELTDVKEIIRDLSKRLDRHEENMFIIAGQVQRLIGRIDENGQIFTRKDDLR
jgi:hypothetical protein